MEPVVREYEAPDKEEGTKKYYFLVSTRHSDGSPATKGGALLVAAILPSEEEGGIS